MSKTEPIVNADNAILLWGTSVKIVQAGTSHPQLQVAGTTNTFNAALRRFRLPQRAGRISSKLYAIC
jgi:hypothetical protein